MFTPVKLGAIELKNRLVMAPLTRMRAIDGDVPHPLAKTYYAQRASAGLIISEATQISAIGKGYPATPGIYSAEQTAAWKEIVSAVHAKGGKMIAQLWHVGRISHSSLHPEQGIPEAPSAIAPAGQTYGADWKLHDYETPKAMTTEEIARLLKDFELAAANAKVAGFDGVEIVTKEGIKIHGMILAEGDILIIRSMGGQTQFVPKERIASKKKMDRSLMMSATMLGMTAQDVADIVAYLRQAE